MTRIIRYGQLIPASHVQDNEPVASKQKGIYTDNKGIVCLQCGNRDMLYFHKYISNHQEEIVYCRNCLQLGRVDNMTDYVLIESKRNKTTASYTLPFNLSDQQCYASNKMIYAIQHHQKLLLYAVTGAGKTEMMFPGIQYARQKGYNVAIVSPRVDVVLEISQRILDAFQGEQIDVLHQQSRQQFNGHFVIATIHQLYRFKNHFDLIFVDEVDAFPLAMESSLFIAIQMAACRQASIIYMTATPSKALLAQFNHEQIIYLPARFHRHPLPVPRFKYFKLKCNRQQQTLVRILQNQLNKRRITLVFFHHIETMLAAYHRYQAVLSSLTYVYSEDVLRFEKVEALRQGNYEIVFTTTILERGFTMAHLDVIVIDAQTFSKAALIQIAGRVGRKAHAPDGMVLYLHQGVSLSMIAARREVQSMNRLAREKGWLDEKMPPMSSTHP